MSVYSLQKINNSVPTYLDCWLVDCRRCRAGGAVKDGTPIFRVMCGVVSARPLVLSRLAVVNYCWGRMAEWRENHGYIYCGAN